MPTGIAAPDTPVATLTYRRLSSASDFAAVMDLERRICGPLYDVLPMSFFVVMAQRGGLLVGAFDEIGLLVGFVCSLSTLTRGRSSQWSYRRAVRPEYRGEGIEWRLKRLQREHALELGVDLIEWTFDPLSVADARFNVAALGAVAQQYLADHDDSELLAPSMRRHVPTDQLVARWHLRDAHVARLTAAPDAIEESAASPYFDTALAITRTRRRRDRLECVEFTLDADDPCLAVDVPAAFGEMVVAAPDVARSWRLATRQIFSTYFARGYHVAGFRHDRQQGTGAYLLVENPDRV